MGARAVGCRRRRLCGSITVAEGKGRETGRRKETWEVGSGDTGLIAGGKGRRGETGEGIKREEET